MFDDAVKLTGRLELRLEREDGSIEVTVVDNLVTSVGKAVLASLLVFQNTARPPTHIAVGTGGTPPVVGDTNLIAEAARVALTSANAAGAVYTAVAVFVPGVGSGALAEAGLFTDTAANAGKMFARVVFATINKGLQDTLQITWTVTVN